MTPTEIEALGDERRVMEALWNMTLGKVGKTEWYDPREGIDCTVSEETHERWVAFERKIDAGAYLDAAMMLVPEGKASGGVKFNVEVWENSGVHAPHVRATAWVAGAERCYAATPALALCAAIARAGGE